MATLSVYLVLFFVFIVTLPDVLCIVNKQNVVVEGCRQQVWFMGMNSLHDVNKVTVIFLLNL